MQTLRAGRRCHDGQPVDIYRLKKEQQRMATATASANVAQGPVGPYAAGEPEFRVARKGIMVVLGQLEVNA